MASGNSINEALPKPRLNRESKGEDTPFYTRNNNPQFSKDIRSLLMGRKIISIMKSIVITQKVKDDKSFFAEINKLADQQDVTFINSYVDQEIFVVSNGYHIHQFDFSDIDESRTADLIMRAEYIIDVYRSLVYYIKSVLK